MPQSDPERQCPDCGQTLRFPGNVGGVVMACPVCGHRFASAFRLAGDRPAATDPVRPQAPIAPPSPPSPPLAAVSADPAAPAGTGAAPAPSRALAARVAAIYAKKAS